MSPLEAWQRWKLNQRLYVALALLVAAVRATACDSISSFAPTAFVVVREAEINGVPSLKLALYSLSATGTAHQYFWIAMADYRGQPAGEDQEQYIDSRVVVGDIGSANIDRDDSLLVPYRFTRKAKRGDGRFVYDAGSNTLTITWEGNDVETWRAWKLAAQRSLGDLCALELIDKDRVALPRANSKSQIACTGAGRELFGRGFGAHPPSGTIRYLRSSELLAPDGIRKNFPYGEAATWSPYTMSRLPLKRNSITSDKFLVSSTGVWRAITVDPANGIPVFSYLAKYSADDSAIGSRRVLLMTSHDFNRDGHIYDNVGHLSVGLQIIDSLGLLRGFVFAESTLTYRNAVNLDIERRASSAFHMLTAHYAVDTPVAPFQTVGCTQ